MKIIDGYCFFWTGFMSQWTRDTFVEDGITFNCCEQYMMYHKAIYFNDETIAKLILAETSPQTIKNLGRKVAHFNQDKWDEVKYSIVREGNYLRFSQNQESKDKLLKYIEYELVEASPYDRIWGIGMQENDPNILDTSQWGQNLLGIALTSVMLELSEEKV